MSVLNGAPYIRAAIDSILAQVYADFEFLIIDDGSTDDTSAILRTYTDPRMRVMRNGRTLGLTRSLNLGLACACGEYIARQDADDVSHPPRLQLQLAYLDSHPDVALLGTQARYFSAETRPEKSFLWWKATDPQLVSLQAVVTNPFCHTSVMFRTAVVRDQLGGYAEDFRTNQDSELWSRLLSTHAGANLPEYLVDHRLRGDSVSAGYAYDSLRRIEHVMRRNLERLCCALPGSHTWPGQWCQVRVLTSREPLDGRMALRVLREVFRQQKAAARSLERRAIYVASLLLLARALWFRRDAYCLAPLLLAALHAPDLVVRDLARVLPKRLAARARAAQLPAPH